MGCSDDSISPGASGGTGGSSAQGGSGGATGGSAGTGGATGGSAGTGGATGGTGGTSGATGGTGGTGGVTGGTGGATGGTGGAAGQGGNAGAAGSSGVSIDDFTSTAATSICSALFRCCLAEDFETYFFSYANDQTLIDAGYADKIPPKASFADEADVLAEIEAQSTGAACADGGNGCVSKRLPWQAKLASGTLSLELANGSVDTMSFSTAYPGSTARKEAEGIRMVLRNAELANSYQEVRYEISNHLFDACEFMQEPEEPEAPELGEKVVASCDDGALVVESDPTTFTFKATVNDPNIVAYVEQESQGVACADNGGGCVTKHLPWEAKIENGALTLENLKESSEFMSFVTSYPGSQVTKEGEGMKLELRSSQLASSHVEVRYEIANWFFSTCTFR